MSADLLPTADWYVDARNYSGSGALLDQSANKLHAKLGSVGVAQIVPVKSGGNALSLPAVASNYASVPHAANQVPSGLFDIACRVQPNSWSVAELQTFMSKRSGSVASWLFRKWVGGARFELVVWVAGNPITLQSADLNPSSDNQAMWVRATRDPVSGIYAFYTAPDSDEYPTSWTLNLTSNSNVGAVDPQSYQVEFGSFATNLQLFRGNIKRGVLKDGATTVLDVDFSSQAVGTTSFTATTGQTVTINSSGTDSNDPLYLPYEGEKYLYLPGSNGNNASTPDAATLDLTDELDVRVRLAADNWLVGTEKAMVAKYVGGGNQRSWIFGTSASGKLQLYMCSDGANPYAVAATTDMNLNNGSPYWLRATFRLSDRRVQFFRSDDGASWLQVGSDLTMNAAVTSIFNSTAPLEIGSFNNGAAYWLAGKYFAAEVRSSIDGPIVASFDAADVDSPYTSVTGGAGETWSINRATTGRKAVLVDRPLFLLGGDDRLEVAHDDLFNFAPDEDFTAIVSVRTHTGGTGYATIFGKKGTNNYSTAGWSIFNSNASNTQIGVVSNGVTGKTAGGGTQTAGIQKTLILLRRKSDDSIRWSVNGPISGGDTTVTAFDLRNTNPVHIGINADIEFLGAAIFRRALSDDEIARVSLEFASRTAQASAEWLGWSATATADPTAPWTSAEGSALISPRSDGTSALSHLEGSSAVIERLS